MKRFNKLRVLKWLGLLNCRFNYETLQFEESLKYRVAATLQVLCLTTFGLKLYVSKFWPNEALIQLYLGSIYNYLDPIPKMFMVK